MTGFSRISRDEVSGTSSRYRRRLEQIDSRIDRESGNVAREESVPVILRVVRVVAAGGTRASRHTERQPNNLTYLSLACAKNL